MADRVFPNNTNVDMGSKISFSGIDWSSVEQNIQKNKYASSQDEQIAHLLKMAEMMDNEKNAEDCEAEEMHGKKAKTKEEKQHEEEGKKELKHRDPKGKLSKEASYEEVPLDAYDKVVKKLLNGDYQKEYPELPNFSSEAELFDWIMDGNSKFYRDLAEHEHWKQENIYDTPPDEFDRGANNKGKTTMRKIAFTHPSQISAEAIEAAEAAGDTKLVNTILAARKANRQRIASAIESKMTKEAGLAKRQAQRAAIIKMAEDMSDDSLADKTLEELKELVDAAGGIDKAPEALKNAFKSKGGKMETEATEIDVMAFTSPAKFSKAQREAFNKVALSLGMPKEYVDSMCSPAVSQKVINLANEIKGVYASNISGKTKKAIAQSLVKEAKLSSDSKSEFIDYWNNVLGYQDKDFWPMVAADYDNGKRVN
jgi:hypothetical protein